MIAAKTIPGEDHVKLERTAEPSETLRHNDIVLNVVEVLRPIARAKGCRLHTANIPVRVRQNRYGFPDISISCEFTTNARHLERPSFVLDVRSNVKEPSRGWFDFAEYLKLDSVMGYADVSQNERSVIFYARDASGWRVHLLRDDGVIDLAYLETTLTLEQIYVGITFENTVADGES